MSGMFRLGAIKVAQSNKIRVPMPPSRRAKQFAPFDALKGFREAIAAKEILTTPKRELTEDRIEEIDRKLKLLEKDQLVTVVYYSENEKNYMQITGKVMKIDTFRSYLQIGDTEIDFAALEDIISSD